MVAKGLAKAFGQELRACREAREWTQEELAERAGLHVNAIGLLERGMRTPSLATLATLADQFEMKASAFIARLERRL